MFLPYHKRAGFTLIELIFVVTLIVMLGGLAAPRFYQSFANRNFTNYIKQTVLLFRYLQFKSIEDGFVYRLQLTDDSRSLAFFRESDGRHFIEIKPPLFNLNSNKNFHINFEERPEIYIFPDGSITSNKVIISGKEGEKATIQIQNSLGNFKVIFNE